MYFSVVYCIQVNDSNEELLNYPDVPEGSRRTRLTVLNPSIEEFLDYPELPWTHVHLFSPVQGEGGVWYCTKPYFMIMYVIVLLNY